jgi:DNA-binding FadR family transcriptional regulator
MALTGQGETATAIERPKRGPKWDPPWQGDLGLLRAASPREAVSDAIVGLIRSGELRPGMRLPSEPQLVEMTGISRSSVREAVRSLQTMGLLEVRRGQGTFVRGVDSESMTDAQLLLLLDDHTVLENLVEVRCALEPLIARVAAERATDEDVAAIGEALRALNAAHGMDDWRPPHLAFHKALVDATHNIVLKKIWSLITVFLKDSPLVTGTFQVTMPHVHTDLHEAIKDRDGSKAAIAMARHIDDMRSVL